MPTSLSQSLLDREPRRVCVCVRCVTSGHPKSCAHRERTENMVVVSWWSDWLRASSDLSPQRTGSPWANEVPFLDLHHQSGLRRAEEEDGLYPWIRCVTTSQGGAGKCLSRAEDVTSITHWLNGLRRVPCIALDSSMLPPIGCYNELHGRRRLEWKLQCPDTKKHF